MTALEKALRRIDDPKARKIVIINKRMRGELSLSETERLIRVFDLEAV